MAEGMQQRDIYFDTETLDKLDDIVFEKRRAINRSEVVREASKLFVELREINKNLSGKELEKAILKAVSEANFFV